MKIIHFSDSHAGAFPDSISAFIDKRIVGTFNYTFRRRFLHNMEILQKAVNHIILDEPDVVVCTGDITSTGQPAEFDKSMEVLNPIIKNSNIIFFYIPGNHDVYVKNKRCQEALEKTFASLNGEEFSLDNLPVKITAGDCDFILVNECLPTNIFFSTGYFPERSVEKIIKWCSEEKERPKILLGHFPLRKDYSFLGFRHKVYGQEKIIELLNNGKLDLSLCGHTHKPFQDINDKGCGEIGAGSITRTNDLNIIEYDKTSGNFTHTLEIIS